MESNVTPENMRKDSKLIKILAIICIIIWIIALFVTWNTPTNRYESNIYTSTPIIFWIANILSLLSGIGIIIHQISYQGDKEGLVTFHLPTNIEPLENPKVMILQKKHRSDLWIIGLVLVFFTFISIISLWIIRGYTFNGAGDSLSHLGWIRNIINSGHIESSNFYPITHIYLAQLSEISNISPIALINYMPIIFSICNILFVYCLAKAVLPNVEQALLAILVWMAFLSGFWIQLTPYVFASYYLPLAIFIYIKCMYTEQIQWKIIAIILTFLFPLFHPLVGFVWTGFILVMWLYNVLINNEHSLVVRNNSIYAFCLFALSLIWVIVWTSSFPIWKLMVTDVLANLTTRQQSYFSAIIGDVTYASKYYDVLPVFIKTYIGQIVIIMLAAFSLIQIWRLRISKTKIRKLVPLFLLMPMLIIAIAFLYIENPGFGPNRLLLFFILLCSIFAGYLLYEIIKINNNRDYGRSRLVTQFQYFKISTLSILLSCLFITGVLQLYPSRYTLQLNLQITRTEFAGVNWFVQNRNISIEHTSFTVDIYRWASAILTPTEYIKEGYRYYGAQTPTDLQIPWHFGYDKRQSLGQVYNNDIYMVLSSRDRLAYQETWPEIVTIRLQNKDFAQVEEDTSISKLYSDGGLDVYYIQSNSQTKFEIDPFYWAK